MGELHHLDVGCGGDASVIKSSGATFLIDCHNISEHKHLLPNNKNLRGGVFITHQHRDHFSGLAFLKDNAYSIDCLIYSPYTRRRGDNSVEYEEWQEFESLMTHFKNKGTKTYTPYRQDDFKKPFWSTNGIKFEIIGLIQALQPSRQEKFMMLHLLSKQYWEIENVYLRVMLLMLT